MLNKSLRKEDDVAADFMKRHERHEALGEGGDTNVKDPGTIMIVISPLAFSEMTCARLPVSGDSKGEKFKHKPDDSLPKD